MNKPTRKEVKITAELMARTLHGLDELGRPYAVVIDGIDKIFSNVDVRFATALLRDSIDLRDKMVTAEIEAKAEAAADNSLWPKSEE